jgi:decarbamoylnovobiocin carbamoyltransferase/7-O-carbamoyltransferase
MLTLGLSGNFSAENEDLVPNMHWGYFHDAAACLVQDGVLIAAMEEERLNRIKKTTKFPVNAIRACLDAAGCSAADIDAVGYSWAESFVDQSIGNLYFEFQQAPALTSRQPISSPWRRTSSLSAIGADLANGRLDGLERDAEGDAK